MRRVVVVLSLLTLFFAPAAMAQDEDITWPEPITVIPEGPPGVEVEVIYTNIPGDPSAAVPGLAGVSFAPGTGTTHFDRIYGSPNGNWALTALTDQATTMDEVLIINDRVRAQEGTAAVFAPGDNIGLIDSQVGVNDTGRFIFATNTDGATSGDEFIIDSNVVGDLEEVAQEGDNAPPLPGMATWGSTLESSVICADGTVGFVSDSVGGLPTTENEVVVLGDDLIAQEGVTVPTGQVGSEAWENFDVSDFWVTPDCQHYLIQGDLLGSTTSDDVVVVDGAVVVQEDSILPGSGFANPVDGSGIVGVHLASNGSYYVRGNNDTTEIDWVYSDGTVLAQVGNPIVTGGTELWSDVDFSDCFFFHVGNSNGDYVIGGVSDAASDVNGVLVLNGTEVIIRESDPLDLDGNGMFDDDTFFDTFGNDDGFLTDNGIFYFVATIKDGTGTRVGQGVFRVVLDSAIFADGFESGDTSAWSATVP